MMLRKQLMRATCSVTRSITKTGLSATGQRASLSYASPVSSTFKPVLASSQRIHQLRWQSTEAEKKDEKKAVDGETAKSENVTKEDAVKQELEQKNKEIIDLKDKYLRSVADYRNLQDRTKRDMDAAKSFAIQRFATDLLDSIDNLDRALDSVPKEAIGQTTSNTSSSDPNKAAAKESTSTPNQDLVNLHSGVSMTSDIMLGVMKKHGLERFDPLEREGRKFNPQTDEATFFTKVEGKEDGEVFYTQSKGFTLNGRVVRAAKVGVVKNS